MNNILVFCPTHKKKKKILLKYYFSIWFLTETKMVTFTFSVNIWTKLTRSNDGKTRFPLWFSSYKTKFSSNLVGFCWNIILLEKKERSFLLVSTHGEKTFLRLFFSLCYAHKKVSFYEFLFPREKKKNVFTVQHIQKIIFHKKVAFCSTQETKTNSIFKFFFPT